MKKIFNFILFIFLFTSSNLFAQSTDGLVAYYPFNGNAKDLSGNGNNGKVFGADLTEDRFGNSDKAYRFFGMNEPSYIKVPNDVTLEFDKAFTISIWVKIIDKGGIHPYNGVKSPKGGGHCLFAKDHDRSGMACFVAFENKSPDIRWGNYYKGGVISPTEINEDEWYNFVVIGSNKQFKIYKNNEIVSVGSYNFDFKETNQKDLYFGKFRDEWYPLNGVLDDIRIYNRALTDNEVKDLYTENGWK